MPIYPNGVEVFTPSPPVICSYRLKTPVDLITKTSPTAFILKPDTKVIDSNNIFNASTKRFTLSIAGIYQIDVSVNHNCPSTELCVDLGILKNNQLLYSVHNITAVARFPALNSLLITEEFIVNDYITFSIFTSCNKHDEYPTTISNGVFTITKIG